MSKTWKRIIQINGGHGAGKSTVVTALMKLYGAEGINRDAKGRAANYRVKLPSGHRLFVVGRYETACGGCDAIGSWEEVARRIDALQIQGHVIYEGVLLGTTYGSLGAHLKRYGDRVTFAMLDTPLPVCVQRVEKRRRARGVTTPLASGNVAAKWNAAQRLYARYPDLGCQRATLPYKAPLGALLHLLGESP